MAQAQKKGSKEVVGTLRLHIPAGQASPSPPVGPALGQRGINIMEFCKAFNDKTKTVDAGAPVPVLIRVYKDKSFDFETKEPPASYLIKKAAQLSKGGATPGRGSAAATLDAAAVRAIAESKQKDLNANDVEAAMRIIAGTARSMGIDVKGMS
ncbi:MAG: 50S ribosomal protein L11 [Alphaproteobacteria bacterium GM202ARS2]|nr:50S ribosomal protein L11 [Alphaproteobacteria bacterium GM202ARS2]